MSKKISVLERRVFYKKWVTQTNDYNFVIAIPFKICKYFGWKKEDKLNLIGNNKVYKHTSIIHLGGLTKPLGVCFCADLIRDLDISSTDPLRIEISKDNQSLIISKLKEVIINTIVVVPLSLYDGNNSISFSIPFDILEAHGKQKGDVFDIHDKDNKFKYKRKIIPNGKIRINAKLRDHLELKLGDYINVELNGDEIIISKYID